VAQVHAIVLSGGSAFGLDAATGVMRYLEEKGFGYDVGVAKVPIVPAAILFDLGVGGKPSVRPTADCGYKAAQAATIGPVAEGNVGAGAGATVGKSAGPGRSMKAGIGSASITTSDGLVVAALAAVNAVGDVIDPATGRVVAGVRTADGKGLSDVRMMVRKGEIGGRRGTAPPSPRPLENTTIAVVATNAVLTKAQAQKVAQMAHDGLARAISPAHTPFDGDTIFALATGTHSGEANLSLIGALAAEVMADAILRGATQATGIPGYPAARDLAVAPGR
jgi:L-aminopeptidase/D-esterase-like protein